MQRFFSNMGGARTLLKSGIHRFEAKVVALVSPLALLDIAKKRCKPPLILVVNSTQQVPGTSQESTSKSDNAQQHIVSKIALVSMVTIAFNKCKHIPGRGENSKSIILSRLIKFAESWHRSD
jgi:hypothetical protein